MPMHDTVACRASDREPIDSAVLEEAFVLRGENCVHESRWNLLEFDRTSEAISNARFT